MDIRYKWTQLNVEKRIRHTRRKEGKDAIAMVAGFENTYMALIMAATLLISGLLMFLQVSPVPRKEVTRGWAVSVLLTALALCLVLVFVGTYFMSLDQILKE